MTSMVTKIRAVAFIDAISPNPNVLKVTLLKYNSDKRPGGGKERGTDAKRTYKLKKELREKLETSTNPMSMVVKAQLKSHEVKEADSERRFEITKELIRQCYKQGYSEANTRLVMRFFAMVIRLPVAFKKRIKEVIKKVEEEFKMEYVPLWERDAEKRGMEKKAKETAKNLLKRGIDIETISDATGLKKKEIEKLKETQQGH
jgi:cell division septum initiation protein DivIVA